MRFVDSIEAPKGRIAWRRAVWGLARRPLFVLFALVAVILCGGCGERLATPTRTPFPTWTPTPLGANAPAANAPAAGSDAQQAPAAPTDTPAPVQPTSTPTDTPPSTDTPVPVITDTPTVTPEPSPTPTIAFEFVLETAEKFPTDSLTPNVVRIFLYAYSAAELGLGGYSLNVTHNGVPLVVDEVSTAGAPDVTRSEPSPYTRFTNMNVVFVEAQAGRWEIQLVDPQRIPVGPPAVFDLTADENTRELYVRYRR